MDKTYRILKNRSPILLKRNNFFSIDKSKSRKNINKNYNNVTKTKFKMSNKIKRNEYLIKIKKSNLNYRITTKLNENSIKLWFLNSNKIQPKKSILLINPKNFLLINNNNNIYYENNYISNILENFSKNNDIFIILENKINAKIFLKYKKFIKGILLFYLFDKKIYFDLNILKKIYNNISISIKYLLSLNYNFKFNINYDKINVFKNLKIITYEKPVNYYFINDINFYFNKKKIFSKINYYQKINLNKSYLAYILNIFNKKFYNMDNNVIINILSKYHYFNDYIKFKNENNRLDWSIYDKFFEINKKKVNTWKYIKSISEPNSKIHDFLNRNYNYFSNIYYKLIKSNYLIKLRGEYEAQPMINYDFNKIIFNKYFLLT